MKRNLLGSLCEVLVQMASFIWSAVLWELELYFFLERSYGTQGEFRMKIVLNARFMGLKFLNLTKVLLPDNGFKSHGIKLHDLKKLAFVKFLC